MILSLTRLDGKTMLVNMDCVTTVELPLGDDNDLAHAVFTFVSGTRLGVRETYADIEHFLRVTGQEITRI